MRILVTGANGYLGQGIVTALLDEGHEVIALDLFTDNVDTRAEKINADIFNEKYPYECFGKPDAVFHLAWRDGFKHYSDKHFRDLPLHYSFLKGLVDAGVEKVAVMGTMHEVGFYEGSIDEFTPCNPMNLYGIAKDALRKSVQQLAEQNNVIFQWIRAYYIVGNSECGNSIFSKLTTAVKEGKTEFPFTTGQNQYDFIDYDEFCRYAAKIVSQNRVNGIINCCSGKPEKLCDRVERFIKENKYKIKLQYGMFPERKYDSLAVWGNNNKLKKIVGENKWKTG